MSPAPASWQEHIAVLFRRAQFVHNVTEQSQSKEPRMPSPRKMSLMWWKCIKLTGRAEANVSTAAGRDAALSTSASEQPGSVYGVLSLVIKKKKKKARRPRQSVCHRKRIKTFYLFIFFMWAGTSGLLTLLSLQTLLRKPNTKWDDRSIIRAADKRKLDSCEENISWLMAWRCLMTRYIRVKQFLCLIPLIDRPS